MTSRGERIDGTDGSVPIAAKPVEKPVDSARIAKLKRAIELGEYPIEERLIAEKIIERGALDEFN